MDIAAIPALQSMSHLPVFADPTHAPRREMVAPLSKAVVAAGASGIFIELDPEEAALDARGIGWRRSWRSSLLQRGKYSVRWIRAER
ncbi:hypothetical protein [Paenibacillus hemerocallicola]|uniref:hypothetical protein n=1 Tax=Paenibacillus hemerocallicola TaxID=1172614 RepID=UPI001FE28AC9|nr:hypothetical protein [Paenibacillus hemerocallicola]